MKTSLKILSLANITARYGNVNSISDAGVAALAAEAAVRGAGLNVLINLADIDDEEFCNRMKDEVKQMVEKASREKSSIIRKVENVILGE